MTRFLTLIAALVMTATSAIAEDLVVRTELSRTSVPGNPDYDVVISRLELWPGGRIPLHTHPGDEYAVIVEGGDVTLPDGKEASFPNSAVLYFPAGEVHGGVTSRDTKAIVVITTHVVEADKPFTVLAE